MFFKMESKKLRSCFVPGCNTGYAICKDKRSLFKAPSDEEKLKVWRESIPRADKELERNCAVCELHFEEKYIERYYRHVINGKEVKYLRGKALLKPEAVPTIFPRAPPKHTYAAKERKYKTSEKLPLETSLFDTKENNVCSKMPSLDTEKTDIYCQKLSLQTSIPDTKMIGVCCEKPSLESCILDIKVTDVRSEKQVFPTDRSMSLDEHQNGHSSLSKTGFDHINSPDSVIPWHVPMLNSELHHLNPLHNKSHCFFAKTLQMETSMLHVDGNGAHSVLWTDIDNLNPPKHWSKLMFEKNPQVFAYSRNSFDEKNLEVFHNILIVAHFPGAILSYADVTVLIYGHVKYNKFIKSVTELQEIFENYDNVILCSGAGMYSDFPDIPKSNSESVFQDRIFSEKCFGTVQGRMTACLYCKYVRKKLIDKRSKQKLKRNEMGTNTEAKSNKLELQSQKIRRLTKRLLKQRKKIEELKKLYKNAKKSTVQDEIINLPDKQQLAVNACFEAASRKAIKGMLYEPDWLIECFLMETKSPELYKYIRDNKILVLPSKKCLQKYLVEMDLPSQYLKEKSQD